MRRREFITLLGSASAVWPLAAHAQTSRRLGILALQSPQSAEARGFFEAFSQGLKEHGWIEGQNVSVEYRFAEGRVDALTKLAAELVQLQVDVILADGSAAINAAHSATQTVPIVMTASIDPVGTGFVASLSRPGGNITGLSILAPELAGKRLQLLTEIVPGLARVAVLANPSSPAFAILLEQTQTAAQRLGVSLHVVEAINAG